MEQSIYFAYRYYLYQIKSNEKMARNVEEHLRWRLDTDEEQSGVAKTLIGEHSRRNGGHRDGNGRPTPPGRKVWWERRGGGNTPHPGSARQTARRSVLTLVEEGPPAEDHVEAGAHPEKNEAEWMDRPARSSLLYEKRWWKKG